MSVLKLMILSGDIHQKYFISMCYHILSVIIKRGIENETLKASSTYHCEMRSNFVESTNTTFTFHCFQLTICRWPSLIGRGLYIVPPDCEPISKFSRTWPEKNSTAMYFAFVNLCCIAWWWRLPQYKRIPLNCAQERRNLTLSIKSR